jgi:hypothetical protein
MSAPKKGIDENVNGAPEDWAPMPVLPALFAYLLWSSFGHWTVLA